MILMLCFLSIKTFSYLNIFEAFSPLVSMLTQVMIDLKEFLFMFFVCLINFSLIITTLQNDPTINYQYVGIFYGSLIDTLKVTMGDFELISRT